MSSKNLRLFAELIRGDGKKLLGAVAAVAVTAAIGFVTPLVLAGTIDALIAAAKGEWSAPLSLTPLFTGFFEGRGGIRYLVEHLWLLAAFLFALYLISGFVQYLRGRLVAQACESFAEKARNRLYAHLQALPYDYHVKAETGDLIQRCISDVETVRKFLSNQAVEAFRTVFMLAVGIPILLNIDKSLTFYSVVLFIPLFLFAMWFFRWVMRYFAVSDAAEGKMSAVLQENLSAVRVVRAFGRQNFEEEKFDRANDDFRRKSTRLYDTMSVFWSGTDMIGTGQIGIALIAGVSLAVKSAGRLSAGDVTVFATYVSLMIWPMRQLGRILSEFGKSLVSLGRLNDILLAQPEQDAPGAADAPLNRDITFDHVSFSYPEGKPVLKDVCFTARHGETVAILGATGCGKSTMMYLLQRLYDPTSGAIYIGDTDIRKIRKKYLRSRVGLVLQEPFLYSRSVRDNIRIARPDVDEETLISASRAACADPFIREFERGYDTPVGERGVTLSGGQKQRVAIARTLLKENNILIFDDSLSAVDTQTDRAILEALRQRRERGETSATVFLISHRLTTLSRADRILVLEDGRITQQGTHDELIRADGLYRRVFRIQTTLEEELAQEA